MILKVKDHHGQLFQVVIINKPSNYVEQHKQILLKIGNPLLGWIYSNPVLSQGFPKMDDLPSWMTEQQKKIALS